jgi:hypothetical protein
VNVSMRARRGLYMGCTAGALFRAEYLDGLNRTGFPDTCIEFTQEVAR